MEGLKVYKVVDVVVGVLYCLVVIEEGEVFSWIVFLFMVDR